MEPAVPAHLELSHHPRTGLLGNLRRIRESFRHMRMAAASLVACAPLLLVRRPETLLRLLCIAAFDYVARVQGQRLQAVDRLALAYACDFGALRNDFYDQGKFDRGVYREVRHGLRRLAPEKSMLHYIHALRASERGRPVLGGGGDPEPAPVVQYRNQTILISLLWLQDISGRSLPAYSFNALLMLAALAQLVDDLLDCRDDWACGRPTFVTACFHGGTTPAEAVARRLYFRASRFRQALSALSRHHREVAPLALTGACIWLLAVALVKVRFRR